MAAIYNFTEELGNVSMEFNPANITGDCDDTEKRWTEMLKVIIDAFVAPVFILFGLCGNLSSFVIFGKISSKIRHMIKADEPDENGTLITILFLRALAVLDSFCLLLTPVPEACMLLYNFIISWDLHHLYYNPAGSYFPEIVVWTIPCGLALQTMSFWTIAILGVLRLSLRTQGGTPSCCNRSTVRAGWFILITCLLCLAAHAPSFQRYKAMSLIMPCTNKNVVTIVSQTDTKFELWIGKVICYSLTDALPFLWLFFLCFALVITFCTSRSNQEPKLVAHWDSRLHGAVFFICFLSCITLGLTTLIAVYDVCNECHDWFENDDLVFNINWWMVLVAESLLVLLQSSKVIVYLIFLRPFRQICACKSDEVINEIGRTQYELHRYSHNSDNTKL